MEGRTLTFIASVQYREHIILRALYVTMGC